MATNELPTFNFFSPIVVRHRANEPGRSPHSFSYSEINRDERIAEKVTLYCCISLSFSVSVLRRLQQQHPGQMVVLVYRSSESISFRHFKRCIKRRISSREAPEDNGYCCMDDQNEQHSSIHAIFLPICGGESTSGPAFRTSGYAWAWLSDPLKRSECEGM